MQSKNSSNFEEIAFEYMDFLYAQALHLTSNMESAEIVIQKTFERACSSFEKDEISDYKKWLLGILHNVNNKSV